MFQRILCATDFSDTAESAWEVACDLARVHRAELMLVHVFVELPVYADAAPASIVPIWEEQRAWVEQALEERVVAARAKGLTVHANLRTGAAAQEIAEAAREHRADVLVVGTHGRSGLDRLLIGSVAERIVRIAPCPVLVVKPLAAGERARAAAA